MGDMKRRMLAGEPYIADDPELVADMRRAAGLVARFNAIAEDDDAARAELLDELLGGIGEDSVIRPPVRFDYGVHTTIGRGCFLNYGCVILDVGPVAIGDDVQVGPGVQLLTATHPVDPERRRARWEGQQPITIGDGAWLGGGVIVCPGVSIGAGTVVGAGAVVTRDLPGRVVAAGNPCRVLREID